jgi:hypothetical protein
MIANPCFHCWRDAQGLMNSAEIVVHVMERNRMLQFSNFFENAFVRRVNWRIEMRIVRFCRLT